MALEVQQTTGAASLETPPGVVPRRRRIRSRRGRWWTILLCLLPALVLFVGLVLPPIVLGAYTSLFKWNGFGGWPSNFVGLNNFKRLLTDEIFIGDLWRGLV